MVRILSIIALESIRAIYEKRITQGAIVQTRPGTQPG
jgi:hypothetical protein